MHKCRNYNSNTWRKTRTTKAIYCFDFFWFFLKRITRNDVYKKVLEFVKNIRAKIVQCSISQWKKISQKIVSLFLNLHAHVFLHFLSFWNEYSKIKVEIWNHHQQLCCDLVFYMTFQNVKSIIFYCIISYCITLL